MGGISFPIHEARIAEKDAEIARLRAALEEIAKLKQSQDRAAVEEMKSIARNALV